MHQLDKGEANVQLLKPCRQINKHSARMILGVAKAMDELPLRDIKSKQSISEYELMTTYFHLILSCILSSPKQLFLLQWADIEADVSDGKRSDTF
ncbi:hypothetical protein BCV72DRAFT_311168 [Rhizopus microsporus var. microsporus]|uniref:Uncharacterized protein n=1 Tax=Rhizopus microsporus var. microsporus TaxID=86635 RepID=A0A1X0RFD4_RHIZD|nr:hypothetical protein BCV72DRAFT_311168 [Rhizopus microsporus var. microsporus]